MTGPTGTFGFGLMPLLQADDRVARIVGIARRPFDPAAYGWTKLEYRRGDVRDPAALQDAFGHADVVVHLAFLVTGAASGEAIRAINVDGTLNAFRAAAAAGARRFVYASSVAAYGFHPDNPVGMTEDWPVRPAARLFYAQEKAELEHLLQAEAAARPPAPPCTCCARPSCSARTPSARRACCPAPLATAGPRLPGGSAGSAAVPGAGAGAAGAARARGGRGAGAVAVRRRRRPAGRLQHRRRRDPHRRDFARELGMLPVPFPRPAQAAARAMAALPFLPPVAQWVEAASHPAIMDTTRAKKNSAGCPASPRWRRCGIPCGADLSRAPQAHERMPTAARQLDFMIYRSIPVP